MYAGKVSPHAELAAKVHSPSSVVLLVFPRHMGVYPTVSTPHSPKALPLVRNNCQYPRPSFATTVLKWYFDCTSYSPKPPHVYTLNSRRTTYELHGTFRIKWFPRKPNQIHNLGLHSHHISEPIASNDVSSGFRAASLSEDRSRGYKIDAYLVCCQIGQTNKLWALSRSPAMA